MKILKICLWLCASVLIVPSAFAAQKGSKFLRPAKAFAKLSKKLQKRILKGEIPVEDYTVKRNGKSVGIALARTLIKASPMSVFNYMKVFKKRPLYMPRLKVAKVMKKLKGNNVYVYQRLNIMWKKIHLHLKIKLNPGKSIRWGLMPGKRSDVTANVGAWVFEPIKGGKHTLLTYSLYTEPRAWVPGWLKSILVKQDIPKVLRNVRKYVESKGKFRK
jgi:hypothetical protein